MSHNLPNGIVAPLKDNPEEGYEQDIDINADSLAANGFYPQNSTSHDGNVGISRDTNNNLVLKDPNAGTKTLSQLLGEGVTSIDVSGGTTGLTTSGGPVTSTGTITLAGTLGVGNGGTGLTTSPASGKLLIGNGTGYTLSSLTAGSNVTITEGAGSITIAASYGGPTNWTEAVNTSSPNATVPAISWTVANAATNVDAVLSAKGTGATLAQAPNNQTTGGNKRGTYATDWQKSRSAITQVASGDYAVIGGGQNNKASGAWSAVLGGDGGRAENDYSVVVGGSSNSATNDRAAVLAGDQNTASGAYSVVANGSVNFASGSYSAVINGTGNSASGNYSGVLNGRSNTANAYGQLSGGLYAYTFGSVSATTAVATDPLLTLGNGSADTSSNALVVLKNAKTGIGLGQSKPTEMLDVGGNVKFSGALMPDNSAGTSGQVLTSAGAGVAPTWTTLNATGTVTSVDVSGGTTGLTTSGGPVTSSGTITLAGTLGVANGGTGLTATPASGKLLIGNGTGYTLASLTAGSNVTITEGAGSISIASSGAVTKWTETESTSSPNDTIPAVSWTPSNAAADVDAVIAPKGTGALLASLPDGLASGGMKRGSYAVDLQRVRTYYDQVVQGEGSVITGGSNNTVTGPYSVIPGGYYNAVGGASSGALSGENHLVNGALSAILGGSGNRIDSPYSAIVGGASNRATGWYSVILNGSNITANSYGQISGGVWPYKFTDATTSSFVYTDPLVTIGNGTDFATGASNALTILKNAKTGIGLGQSKPTEMLHVGGNVRFSGALMPNNSAGTSGQVLTSAGAGAAPTWTTVSSSSGTVTSIDVSGGTTGLTTSGGPITSSGTITLAGTLAIANGGTGNATAPSDGKLLIGKTDGSYSVANLTAGSNITIANGNGTITIAASGGGATNWTEAVNTSAPNATIPAVSWTPNNAATNVDAIIKPKGTGALLAATPDNTATGGNKRGSYAVDWQTYRNQNTQVASGLYSVVGGGSYNLSSGEGSATAGGSLNSAIGDYGFVGGGYGNYARAGKSAVAGGESNDVKSTGPWGFIGGGRNNIVSGYFAAVINGWSNTAASYCEVACGAYNYSFGGSSSLWEATDPVWTLGNGTDGGPWSSNAITVLKNAKTGIGLGQSKPSEMLHVAGNIRNSGALIQDSFTAGETIAAGNVCYLNADGKVYKAKADSASTSAVVGVAVASASANASIALATFNKTGGFTSLTTGTEYFLSATSFGAAVTYSTLSATSGAEIVSLGYARSATEIQLNIQRRGTTP